MCGRAHSKQIPACQVLSKLKILFDKCVRVSMSAIKNACACPCPTKKKEEALETLQPRRISNYTSMLSVAV